MEPAVVTGAAPILSFPLSQPAPSQGEGTPLGGGAEIQQDQSCRGEASASPSPGEGGGEAGVGAGG
jgi:hypothetical protein